MTGIMRNYKRQFVGKELREMELSIGKEGQVLWKPGKKKSGGNGVVGWTMCSYM